MSKISKNNFEEIPLFSTLIYAGSLLNYVDLVKQVAEDPIYHPKKTETNVDMMSTSFFQDKRIADFSTDLLKTSWDILKSQGHLMENYLTIYESMWLQTYQKHAHMHYHSHANGVQIVGFYFLEVPDQSSRLILHDPRIAKTQIQLDEADTTKVTNAAIVAVYHPKAGDLILTPAWLAHSITPNQSDELIKFVHINIQTQRINNHSCNMPTII